MSGLSLSGRRTPFDLASLLHGVDCAAIRPSSLRPLACAAPPPPRACVVVPGRPLLPKSGAAVSGERPTLAPVRLPTPRSPRVTVAPSFPTPRWLAVAATFFSAIVCCSWSGVKEKTAVWWYRQACGRGAMDWEHAGFRVWLESKMRRDKAAVLWVHKNMWAGTWKGRTSA